MTHRATGRCLAWGPVIVLAMLIMLACALGWAPARANAGEPARARDAGGADLSAPYATQATGRSPLDVLQRFADDHGLNLRLAPAADRSAQPWRTARLAGWVRGESGRDFLEQLALAYHFDWFVAYRTLHVSARSDSTVERIALHGMAADTAQAALAAVGLYDERFGWGVLTGHDAVLVSGPRQYLSLVRRFLATQAPPSQDGPPAEPMIFPLRHAQAADDAAFDGRDGARPGVATILRQLVAPADDSPSPRFFVPTAESMPALPDPAQAPLPIAGQGLANWFGVAHRAPPLPDWRATSAKRTATRLAHSRESELVIVADERTNTVLVWGNPALRTRLERIIEALDQPLPMVSMEVLVLEADEAAIRALAASGDGGDGVPETTPADIGRMRAGFDVHLSQALDEQRAKVLNRQALVGFANLHVTLAIGAEESHRRVSPPDASGQGDDNANGRAGHRGDALDLVARLMPARASGRPAIAIDVGLLMAQPTGLPGQEWDNTSSVKLKTAVALEGGGAPRLIATYPVATSRNRQRAIFVSAGTL